MAIRRVASIEKDNVKVSTYWVSEYQEYQVKLAIDGIVNQDANYYTADKADAISTANDMLARAVKQHS